MVKQVIVSTFENQKITIDLCETDKEFELITVRQLKAKIVQKLPGKPESMMADMKLIFTTNRLDPDTKRLREFGIEHKSLIQMVMSLDGGRAA